MGFLIGLLRVVRGFCGFILISKLLGVLSALNAVNANDTVMVLAMLDAVMAVVGGLIFFLLRKPINYLHKKRTHLDELLLKSMWSL